MRIKNFITESGERQIIAAIEEAELNTSGEIRVHIESLSGRKDPLKRAIDVFNHLKMYNTKDRNGVLIYVAVKSRTFAIIGDVGINSVVPDNFWDSIKMKMGELFAKGEFVEGLCFGIREAGMSLKQYFPYQSDDVNEQPNEISFGD